MSTFRVSLPLEDRHGRTSCRVHYHEESAQCAPIISSSSSASSHVMPPSSSSSSSSCDLQQHSTPCASLQLHSDGRRSGDDVAAVDWSSGATRATRCGGAPEAAAYYGVRKRRWGRWVSEIREPKKKRRIWLGSFAEPEMAARAYDVAARCLRGGAARLNFPHLAPFLPSPASADPHHIQAAAQAAAHFRFSGGGGGGLNTININNPCCSASPASASASVSPSASSADLLANPALSEAFMSAECAAAIESSSDSTSAAAIIQQQHPGHRTPSAPLIANLESEAESWESMAGSREGKDPEDEWRMWDMDEWVEMVDEPSKSSGMSLSFARSSNINGGECTSKSSFTSCSAAQQLEEEEDEEEELEPEEYIMMDKEYVLRDGIVFICRTTTTGVAQLDYDGNVYGEMNSAVDSDSASASAAAQYYYDDFDSQQLLMINLWDCSY